MLMNTLSLLLSLTFSISVAAQTDAQIIASQIKEARAITDSWMAKKKDGIKKRDIYEGQVERAVYIVSGIPSYVKEVNPKNVVYRHYTGANTEIIVKTSQLKTGITPYVTIQRGFGRETFEDLTGMFLTYPTTPPENVGLAANPNADYIDFTLYDGTPVVEIEKEILLIPGRADLPVWLKALYQDYKATGRVDTQYIELFKKVDARGGVNPTFMKINIKSYRMGGKLYKKGV